MAEPLSYLRHRVGKDWLVGYDNQKFTDLAEQLYQQLTQLVEQEASPRILLAQRDPVQFLAGFVAACAAGCPVFLGNPDWVEREWQQVLDTVQPNLIWQEGRFPLAPGSAQGSPAQPGWIMFPTGGSSGEIRFATHTWSTLIASVQGFRQYFQVEQIHSFCVLPLYHVSGLMQFMRSFTSEGRLVIQPFKVLEAAAGSDIDPADFFLSLVPTQLQRLLEVKATAWLCRCQTVLLGGAPAWPKLLAAARGQGIWLAPTYGMTETASQIATLKPEAFLSGNNSCGQVLPHAGVTICSPTGEVLGANQTGVITIRAESLALGYYPTLGPTIGAGQCAGDDLGFLDAQGYLTVVGRSSNKIITGGENVFPAEVEAAIRATNLVEDVCVLGIPDHDWGEVVSAVYVSKAPLSPEVLQISLEDQLSKFKRPKYWMPVSNLPRNSQGKVNREQLQQKILAWKLSSNDA